jgi:Calcium binding
VSGEDEARERRTTMEIAVDAYTEDERVAGWYCYLEENLKFAFTARYISESPLSPLLLGDEGEVIQMAPIEECENGMMVETEWLEDDLILPLEQLEGLGVEERTRKAIEDWRYWVARVYAF